MRLSPNFAERKCLLILSFIKTYNYLISITTLNNKNKLTFHLPRKYYKHIFISLNLDTFRKFRSGHIKKNSAILARTLPFLLNVLSGPTRRIRTLADGDMN